VSGLQEGAGLLVGALLACAGLLKLAYPRAFMRAVRRLLPARARWAQPAASIAAPTVGTAELAIGVTVASTPRLASPLGLAGVAAASLFTTGFVVVVRIAIRKGAACGCWSSFSDATAGGGELARTLWLAAVSLALLASDIVLGPPKRWNWAAVGWLVLLAAGMVGATLGGRKLLPADGRREKRNVGSLPLAELVRTLSGRVTCARIRTVRTLKGDERAHVVATVLATPSGRAVQEWFGATGDQPAWDRCVVRETSVERDGGMVRQVVVAPPTEVSSSLRASATLDDSGGLVGDAIFLGTIKGEALAAAAGTVVYGGSVVPARVKAEHGADDDRTRDPHAPCSSS
jgi:hypothetical protein